MVESAEAIRPAETLGVDTSEATAFDVSLVVVASNERVDLKAFADMIDAFRNVFFEAGIAAEYIVVDDGIGGDFWEALKAFNAKIPSFRAVRFRRTFGESVALRIGAERASAPFIVTNTWYLQVEPQVVTRVLELMRSGTDYVAARRAGRVDSLVARVQSFGFNLVTRWLAGADLHDLNCSFRGFTKEVIQHVHFHGDLFRFVPILALGQGFHVEEIEVRHVAEKGPSTFLNINLYIRRFLDIFSLFFLTKFIRKPLRFFGLSGLSLFVVGFVISMWVAMEKFFGDIGMLDRPQLVLGIFLMVLGPILLSIGLIGEIIIFTQGGQLQDYHIDTILTGRKTTREEESHGSSD
jgi:glycosyltransferase involved in cell wall biosynthesis